MHAHRRIELSDRAVFAVQDSGWCLQKRFGQIVDVGTGMADTETIFG